MQVQHPKTFGNVRVQFYYNIDINYVIYLKSIPLLNYKVGNSNPDVE